MSFIYPRPDDMPVGNAKDDSQEQQERLRPSCTQCQRRKVKCDRQSPCNECDRLRLQCVPSTRKPRAKTTARAKNAVELRQRVAKLEQLVQTMSGEQVAREVEEPPRDDNLLPFQYDTSRSSPATTAFQERNTAPSPDARPANPTVPTLAKKYVGGSFWSSLTEEVNALADVLDNDDLLHDDNGQGDLQPTSAPQYATSAPLSRPDGSLQPEVLLYPPNISRAELSTIHEIDRWDVPRLLDAYANYAEPPIKLFHLPSLRALVLFAAPYLRRPADAPCNQFLTASVCFAGLNALTEEDCWALYGMPKAQAVQGFRNVVDAALHRADPLVSTDLATLQALLLYAMTIRITDSSRRSWAIVGTIVHTARSVYLHRATPNESPYMGQVRLRLWHCIVFMSHYSARDRGTESTIRGWCPSPTMPIDCNDDDFDEYSTHIEPRTNQITDMTVALISYGGVVVSNSMEQPGQTWKQRLDLAEGYRAKLDREVRPLCEQSLPHNQYIVDAATIVCNSMVLRAVRPLHLHDEESPPSVSDPWVLRIGVDLLKSALQLLPFVEKGWRRMPWIPWHAIVVVLAGLCTIRDTDLANEAWPIVERSMAACERDVADTKDGLLWRPIRKVHAKALAYRDANSMRAGADGDRPLDLSNVLTGHVPEPSGTNGFAQPDPFQYHGPSANIQDAQSNSMEMPLPDDTWLNWEAIMTDIGANEPLFRDDF